MDSNAYLKILKFMCERLGLSLDGINGLSLDGISYILYYRFKNDVELQFYYLPDPSSYYIQLGVDCLEFNPKTIVYALVDAAKHGDVYLGGTRVFMKKGETLEKLLVESDLHGQP